MKSLPAVVIFYVLILPALADVHTNNNYFVDSATVNEDVYLKNFDYKNIIDIYPTSILTSSAGRNSAGSMGGSAKDSIMVMGADGPIGASLSISAEEAGYGRALSAGDSDEIQFKYGLTSGTENAYFYNKWTSLKEHLLSESNTYKADSDVMPGSIMLDGYGSRFSFEDKNSSFIYDILLRQKDLWADTHANLSAIKINDVKTTPVVYKWNASAFSDGSDYAQSYFDMAFVAGDRQVDAVIRGEDSDGSVHTVPLDGTPWHVGPMPTGKNMTGVETIEEWIKLMKQGMVNSGNMSWILEPP